MTKTTATTVSGLQGSIIPHSVDMLEPNRDWTNDPREDLSSDTGGPELALDLERQLEGLFTAVARAEANWRVDDLLDVAEKQRRVRERHSRAWRPLQ